MGVSERLVYLAAELQPHLPQNGLMKYVPQGSTIEKIAKYGIEGAAKDFDMPKDQFLTLYERGRESGKGSVDEFKMLLASQMLDNVEIQRGELSTSEYLDLTRQIAMYSASEEVELIRDEVIDLGNDSEFELDNVIPKWETGFTPMDAITGGHYQSITMLIGRPGHGKTSLMLSILESMVISNVASSVWFVELEIPGELMRYRIKPIRERTNFRKGKDLLLCGNHTIESIQEMVKENPDPGRVIFIDSPDVMASGAGEQKRHVLEEIYLKLIQLKWDTQALIVSSWPRRRDRTISLESAAEAWAKAWYSDIIIGLAKLGQTRSGMNNVRLNIVKNRFGPSEQETTFQYNYNDLSWDYTGGSFNEEDW